MPRNFPYAIVVFILLQNRGIINLLNSGLPGLLKKLTGIGFTRGMFVSDIIVEEYADIRFGKFSLI